MAATEPVFVAISGSRKRTATAFVAEESLSEVPSYRVFLRNFDEQLENSVGKEIEVTFRSVESAANVKMRDFHGIVTQAEIVANEKNTTSKGAQLILTAQPFLAILGYSRGGFVYQQKTSVEILKMVLERNGLKQSALSVTAQPPVREMCVQYNENDLDFCKRILSEDGLTFYFHDGKTSNVMIVHDADKPYPANKAGDAELTDLASADPALHRAASLSLGRRLAVEKITLATYNVERAAQSVGETKRRGETERSGSLSITEYRAITSGDVKNGSRILARQSCGDEKWLRGKTTHPGLFLGQVLEIKKARDPKMTGRFVIHRLRTTASESGLTCAFTAAPTSASFTPPIVPKPLISGVHNAIVVGDKKGAPACDASGRIKVKFFWDMSDAEKDTSCWIRVCETFAGAGYGGQFIPRVGHEVLVSFLNGDPDAPVVVGSVHNEKNKRPYVKANVTASGVTTKLFKNANELIFEDEEDKERLALRAARDYELAVTQDASRSVGRDESTEIKGKASRKVGDAYAVDVKTKMTLDADSITLTGKTKILFQVGGSQLEMTSTGVKIKTTTLTIESQTLSAKGNVSFEVSGAQGSVKANGPLKLEGLTLTAEGSVMAKVKGGAMLSLEGGGLCEVKGVLTKIN